MTSLAAVSRLRSAVGAQRSVISNKWDWKRSRVASRKETGADTPRPCRPLFPSVRT